MWKVYTRRQMNVKRNGSRFSLGSKSSSRWSRHRVVVVDPARYQAIADLVSAGRALGGVAGPRVRIGFPEARGDVHLSADNPRI
jgi:hypothetical protein